ncbi:MAG: hypothetical protein K2L86_09905, partial [Lachnospiraceae bacterium]|nr:hypothetical protein [Lachnospiraceae bacterium]
RSALLLFLSVFLFFIPVFTTFEAWHVAPQIKEDTFEINSQNAILINNEYGTYDLYIDNNYVGTVSEVFNQAIPIIERNTKNEIQ